MKISSLIIRLKKHFLIPSVLLILVGCSNDINKINALNISENSPIESDKGVVLYYSTHAHIDVKLTAPSLQKYNGAKPYTVFPKGIAVYFFDSTNKVSSQLTADYAINREYKSEMEAKGNVVVNNAKGDKLNSEDLIWNEKKNLIYSNKFVKITKKNEILMGTGFESNSDFTNYKIKNLQGDIILNNDTAQSDTTQPKRAKFPDQKQ